MPIGSGRATRISSTSKDTGALDIEGSRVSGFGLNNIYKGSDTTTVLGALRAKTICATLRNKIIGITMIPRFPSSPLTIRVSLFLLFGFNQGAQKEKGQKGTTGEPRYGTLRNDLIHFLALPRVSIVVPFFG